MSNSLGLICRKLVDNQKQEQEELKKLFQLIAGRSESNRDVHSFITDIIFNSSYIVNDLGLLARSENKGEYPVPREEIIQDLYLPTVHLLNVVTFCLKQKSADFDKEIQGAIFSTFGYLEDNAETKGDVNSVEDVEMISYREDKYTLESLFRMTTFWLSQIVLEASRESGVAVRDSNTLVKFLAMLIIICKLFEFDLSNAHRSI